MTSTSTRGRQLVLLAVLVGALAGGVAGATAGTGPDAGSVDTSEVVSPTVVVDDANVDADTTERVDVTLSSAPNGLAGYNLTLRVTDPGVATITDASVAERFGRSNATIVDGGSAVVLKAADTAGVVETDASDLALADVELTGQAVGSTEMTVEVTRIDDDRRGRVNPATDPGAVSVTQADDDRRGRFDRGTNTVSETPSPTTTTTTTSITTITTTAPPTTTTPPPTATPPPTTTPTSVLGVEDVSVTAGAVDTVAFTLSSAPNGLAGYNLTLRVTDPGVATITDASVAEQFGRSDATIVDGGSAVVLKAADTAGVVETDASDLALADVELTGQAVGSTEMTVEVTRIDDDRRGRVDPATDPGAVSVISGTTTTPATPTTITPTTTATPTTPTTTAAPPVVPTTVPTTATPTITTTTATPTITTTTATPTTTTTTATPTVTTTTATPTTTTPEPGDDRQTVSRFDGVGGPENGRIGSDEVLTGVAAYNANNTVGGEPVTTQDVLDLIAAFNRESSVFTTVDRFDGVGGPEDGRIGSDEVLTGVAAYNADNTVGGEPVTTQDVLDLIAAFNQDDDDER